MAKDAPIRIELLAPARDAATAIEAIKHGADAVYMGAPSHGARAAVTCSLDELRRAVDAAHPFGAKVYATVNTLIYDHELDAVESMIRDLYRIGIDALIVQDMGVLRMDIPPIPLHASTQCDTRDVAKARRLEDAGFSQIVLARELSTSQIEAIHREVKVPLEAFIHGALCVSFSGDCRASLATTGRSGNRGECAQVCRYAFDLLDADGNRLIERKHLLSLRDMNRTAHIAAMMEAGVSSFKIEGRLKDVDYVKNVTAHYRRVIDEIIAASDGRYVRSSYGESRVSFTPDVKRSFNRGFTDYFADSGDRPAKSLRMASIDTPKWRGERVARVKSVGSRYIEVVAECEIHNGDGLGYTERGGSFHGFRVNRVEGNKIFPATRIDIEPDTILYRNRDKAWDDLLAAETATRSIAISATLRMAGIRLVLDLADERGNQVTVTQELPQAPERARTPQMDNRLRVLSKTGGTIYRMMEVTDECGDLFIPASALSELKRKGIEALDCAQRITYPYEYRRKESSEMLTPERLTYHDNVANRKARQFYREHGTKMIEPAAEVKMPSESGMRLMTTRYCLRREMGRCLREPDGKAWKEPLTLASGATQFGLEFDCARCLMHVNRK